MPSHELTRRQKNAVLEAIRSAGLDPLDFDWQEVASTVTQRGSGSPPFTVERLYHRPTEYWFCFDVENRRGWLWAIFTPGREGVRQRENVQDNFAAVWSYFVDWLGRLKQEHDAPDLWAELENQRDLMIGEAPEEVENTPFTQQEKAQIASSLNEAKEYVRATRELTPAQYEAIDARLDYLVEAAERVGRIDWRNLLAGTFLSLVVQAVVPIEPVRDVLFVALRGLGAMFGSEPPELPGSSPELI